MVKPGYKQTEIGVIPQEWEVKKLKDIADFIGGGTPSRDKSEYWQGNIPWISSSDISLNTIHSLNINRFITERAINESATQICPKDTILVVSRVGVGKIGIAPTELCTSQDFTNIVLRKNNIEYVARALQPILQSMVNMSQGTSIKGITTDEVKNLAILIPPAEEQDRISEAILNAEKLVTSLEKQIYKKKAIKQGAMQELLTGKKRLPGFEGEWRTEIIPNVLQKQEGIKIGPFGSQLKKEYLLEDGPYRVYGQENVFAQDFSIGNRYLNREKFKQLQSCEIHSGDFLISTMGTVGKCAIVPSGIHPGIMDSHLIRLRINEKTLLPEYLLHLFSEELGYLKAQTSKLSVGGIMDGLSTKIVNALVVYYPEELNEQQAIASILSDMDDEITKLEHKLDKYRQVKQGMMQQLLTGKIRLKNDVVDSVQAEQVAATKTSPARSAHNHQFDDAVAIAAIVDAFYSEKYPLGRVKVQKLLYLLHRHQAVSVSDFKKKAAGPYADTVRYRGGEPIAKKNKYIVSESGKQGTRYSKGENMAQALDYVERWGMQADLQWLKENFLHTSRNDLELFATVDMAMCDLNEAGVPISVASIKNLIASNKEWKAKLSKTYFSDSDIARAIKKCAELFH